MLSFEHSFESVRKQATPSHCECAQLSVVCLLIDLLVGATRDFHSTSDEDRRKESKQAESEEQQRDALEKEGERHIEAAKRSLQKNSYADARMRIQRARLGAVSLVSPHFLCIVSLVSAHSDVHRAPLPIGPEVRVVCQHTVPDEYTTKTRSMLVEDSRKQCVHTSLSLTPLK